MDATVPGEVTTPTPKPTTQPYKSRPGALAWCFRKSRDLWKAKYRDLKASFKRLTHRVADLTKSRDQWRLQAEQAQGRLVALQEQVAGLEAEVAALTAEKKTAGMAIR
jgi:chromosome segregation ATPase